MTPCEKLGYKVGDEFRNDGNHHKFVDGEMVTLSWDDGSNCPFFVGKKGTREAAYLHNLTKMPDIPITLQKGDYCPTANMTEDDYHAVAAAFMAAGAGKGEYPDLDMFDEYDQVGWCEIHNAVWHQGGSDHLDNYFEGRHLTPTQIIGATNAQQEPQTQESKDMHIIDNLHTKRQARDVAEQEYQAALAEVREAYPWIRVDEKPTEDMTDPANWRAGDVVEHTDADLTPWYTLGKEYELKEHDGKLGVIDDDGEFLTESVKQGRFRFIRRP